MVAARPLADDEEKRATGRARRMYLQIPLVLLNPRSHALFLRLWSSKSLLEFNEISLTSSDTWLYHVDFRHSV
jgi:hypothetical protein